MTDEPTTTRRRLLLASASASSVGVAGCADGGGSSAPAGRTPSDDAASGFDDSTITIRAWLGRDVPRAHYDGAFRDAARTFVDQLDDVALEFAPPRETDVRGRDHDSYDDLFAAMQDVGAAKPGEITVLLYWKPPEVRVENSPLEPELEWNASVARERRMQVFVEDQRSYAVDHRRPYRSGEAPLVVVNAAVAALPDGIAPVAEIPDTFTDAVSPGPAYVNTVTTGLARPILDGALRASDEYVYLPDRFSEVNEFGTVRKRDLRDHQASPLATWHVRTAGTCFREARWVNNDYVERLCSNDEPATACGYTTDLSACTKSTVEQYLLGPLLEEGFEGPELTSNHSWRVLENERDPIEVASEDAYVGDRSLKVGPLRHPPDGYVEGGTERNVLVLEDDAVAGAEQLLGVFRQTDGYTNVASYVALQDSESSAWIGAGCEADGTPQLRYYDGSGDEPYALQRDAEGHHVNDGYDPYDFEIKGNTEKWYRVSVELDAFHTEARVAFADGVNGTPIKRHDFFPESLSFDRVLLWTTSESGEGSTYFDSIRLL